MPIFRYTSKKILVTPSTWVILAITIIILTVMWLIPFAVAGNVAWTKEIIKSTYLSQWRQATFFAFIGLMLLIFIAVKSTQIFRDEIDDGTLLILVSKPISRNRIWCEKWLSFQTMVVSYIFLSIFISSIFLAIPGLGGGSVVYTTFLPYMGILFGISLIFDLIFTSIVLLISMVLNSKATIALTIGFAALTTIFATIIDPLVNIPQEYYQVSHATAVFQNLESKVGDNQADWMLSQSKDLNLYKQEITDVMAKVYKNDITNIKDYPKNYDPIQEQKVIPEIVKNPSSHPAYTQDDITLLDHILKIGNAFRQWKEQSFEELMTSTHVGPFPSNSDPGQNAVNYSAYTMMQGITLTIDQNALDNINNKVFEKKIMRYFNVFYQLYYLWTGIWQDKNSLYNTDLIYTLQNDPYLVSFKKIEDKGKVHYQVNPEVKVHKILDFPALLSVYVVLGAILLGSSWYVFNRRDFA